MSKEVFGLAMESEKESKRKKNGENSKRKASTRQNTRTNKKEREGERENMSMYVCAKGETEYKNERDGEREFFLYGVQQLNTLPNSNSHSFNDSLTRNFNQNYRSH